MTPAAAYVRVSSTGQAADDRHSLPVQRDAIEQYAADNGYQIVAWYQDTTSGLRLWEREGVTQLRAAFHSSAFQAVIVFKLDRLSRTAGHQQIVLSEAKHAGVKIISLNDALDESPSGELITMVTGWSSEQEVANIRLRTQAGRKARAKSGKPIANGKAPYGLKWADDLKSHFSINEVEAPSIEAIFTAKASGQSLRSIAASLTQSGTPTPAGGVLWNQTTVRYLLTKPIYKGEVSAWNGDYLLPAGTAPAIVSPDLWEQAQRALADTKRTSFRRVKNPDFWLLRGGYLRCGNCDRVMSSRDSYSVYKGKKYHQRQYRCEGLRNDRGSCQTKPSINADKLDALVWAKVTEPLRNPDRLVEMVKGQQGDDPAVSGIKTIDRLLADSQKRVNNLSRAISMADDDDSISALLSDLKATNERRRMLEIERASLLAKQALWQQSQSDLDSLLGLAAVMRDSLDDLDAETTRLLFQALGVTVKVFRADVSPRWEISASIPLDQPFEVVMVSSTGRPGRSRAG